MTYNRNGEPTRPDLGRRIVYFALGAIVLAGLGFTIRQQAAATSGATGITTSAAAGANSAAGESSAKQEDEAVQTVLKDPGRYIAPP